MTLTVNTRVLVDRGGIWCAGKITGLPTSLDEDAIDVDLDHPDRTGARQIWVRAGSPNLRRELICGCSRDGERICEEHAPCSV